MPRLTPPELAGRLAYDHQVVSRLHAPWLGWKAARDGTQHTATSAVVTPGGDGRQTRIYSVSYAFRTLLGAGVYSETPTVVCFDLLAGGNYPYSSPVAVVATDPTPWGPHVGSTGYICLGSAWDEARGRMLLAHLVIHVARILNFDGPDTGGGHMNPAAASWWRTHHEGRPLNPDLAYPILPLDLTHGVEVSSVGSAFRPRGASIAPVSAGFRRRVSS